MKKILKIALRSIKDLQREGVIHLDNSNDMGMGLHDEVVAAIVGELTILINEKTYEKLKGNKKKLIRELAISNFYEGGAIYNFSLDFKKAIIEKFIYLDNPELIYGMYAFNINYGELEDVYERALDQIKKGKFENYIF